MGTLVAYSAIGSKTINVAWAQGVPQPSAQTQVQRFDIAPGPLSEVLPKFARAAGLTFTLSADSIGTITSPGVSGAFTIQDGLLHVVKGTSVTFRFTAPTVVIFELSAGKESVEVKGRYGDDPYADPEAPYKAELSSTKFPQPVLNTARTETILTQEALKDKNATTLREVLRSTAGVTLGSGEGGNAFGDRFFIRGFDARNDVFIDGVRDPGVSIRENFDVEQIEILRGPASSFAGRGTTGGALNIVTKEAQPTDFIHGGVEGGFGDSTRRRQRRHQQGDQPSAGRAPQRHGPVCRRRRPRLYDGQSLGHRRECGLPPDGQIQGDGQLFAHLLMGNSRLRRSL